MQKNQDKEKRDLVLKTLKDLHGDVIEIQYAQIAAVCGISNDELPRYIKHWEEKGFVKTTLSNKVPSSLCEVVLTAHGIEHLEGDDSKPPVIQNVNINIFGDVHNGLEFLITLQNVIEKNPNISEKEKASLISQAKGLVNNPIISNILSTLALKVMGL